MEKKIYLNKNEKGEIQSIEVSINQKKLCSDDKQLSEDDMLYIALYLKKKMKISDDDIFERLANGEIRVFNQYESKINYTE